MARKGIILHARSECRRRVVRKTNHATEGEHLMRRYVMAVVGLFVMILSGCGGSGFLPMMGEPLDRETALMELSAVRAVRDSLLVSDLVFAPGDSQEERIRGHTSCGRTTCLSTISGQPYLRVSLSTRCGNQGTGTLPGRGPGRIFQHGPPADGARGSGHGYAVV